MHTSIVLLALLGPASETTTRDVVWQEGYGAARKTAARENKPLAVFFSSGSAGWQKISSERPLPESARRVLGSKYVNLFVDLDTETGAKLAREFGMKGPGVVLSTPGGNYEAFRHEGSLDDSALVSALQQHAEPARPAPVVAAINPVSYQPAIVSPVVNAVPAYQPALTQPSYAPSFAPTYAQPSYAPAYAPAFGGASFGGSYAAPAMSGGGRSANC